MYMISIFAYHGDIVHYLSVDLYSTEPPEDGLVSVAFCLKEQFVELEKIENELDNYINNENGKKT